MAVLCAWVFGRNFILHDVYGFAYDRARTNYLGRDLARAHTLDDPWYPYSVVCSVAFFTVWLINVYWSLTKLRVVGTKLHGIVHSKA